MYTVLEAFYSKKRLVLWSVGQKVPHGKRAHAHHIIAWVTRPERPKGAKDEVKVA